jgi:hypothetical protein
LAERNKVAALARIDGYAAPSPGLRAMSAIDRDADFQVSGSAHEDPPPLPDLPAHFRWRAASRQERRRLPRRNIELGVRRARPLLCPALALRLKHMRPSVAAAPKTPRPIAAAFLSEHNRSIGMVDPLSSPDLFKRATDNSAERLQITLQPVPWSIDVS